MKINSYLVKITSNKVNSKIFKGKKNKIIKKIKNNLIIFLLHLQLQRHL